MLQPNDRGICRNRINKNGKLYTLAYANPCAVHVDPIEKKPLSHFLPKTTAYSIATAGCNLRCLNCQNWQISQSRPEDTRNVDLPPERVVAEALRYGSKSIAYTYSEPIVFYEYMIDSARLARKQDLRNVWVTAGYINTSPLRELCKVLDAANVDLKSFSDETYAKLNGATLKPVLETLKTLAKERVWFEVTNLVVPTWTDDLNMIAEMSGWLYKNIGPDYPIHFSRFQPQYKLTHLPPTPVEVLEKARKTALDAGMKYVYIGNVPGHDAQNTYCPKCGNLVIKRQGYDVDLSGFDNGVCRKCGESIAGVWK